MSNKFCNTHHLFFKKNLTIVENKSKNNASLEAPNKTKYIPNKTKKYFIFLK